MSNILDDFLTTALWSTVDCSDESDCPRMLDENYSVEMISDEFKVMAEKMCNEFIEKALPLDIEDNSLIKAYTDIKEFIKKVGEETIESAITEDNVEPDTIGHDLWLTIHHHGAGFWDGDYKKGDELTEIAQSFSEIEAELNESLIKDEAV